MKAYIIEDELLARNNLIRTLEQHFPDIEVAGSASSVQEAIRLLQGDQPDIVFMDVELSDGKCFEILRSVKIRSHIVMTTAYDSYALKAFEAGSIDYLLKPIELPALRRSIERCRRSGSSSVDVEKLLSALAVRTGAAHKFNDRFLVHFNDHIVPVKTSAISCFFSEAKDNHVVTKDGTLYVVDSSLDTIIQELDPDLFFKISRSCIIAKDSIESVTKLLGGRLKVSASISLSKQPSPDLTVSRSRSEEFLRWLEK